MLTEQYQHLPFSGSDTKEWIYPHGHDTFFLKLVSLLA
jgi:hypothetical protein